MPGGAIPPLTGGPALLERAIGYALGGLAAVTPESLRRPTPCRGWDLSTLLAHLSDSLEALGEAAALHHVVLAPDRGPRPADPNPVAQLQESARRALGAWSGERPVGAVSVGGLPLRHDLVAAAGALEVAVHGWDLARACGAERPLPEALAVELLPCAVMFVGAEDRPGRFGDPLPVPAGASASRQLLAFLGRRAH
ncbi:TIGR03086 family metal-binding protein [Speluncibacter jeojiensis]|uniref:TIGR03086 family metal-binding protein n=1 Tax=Speluncibacter jeojiensis TaxID=2710754 RepID=UPI00240F8E3F|nr:TIGR03086 family metal-binding protein [Rhodococcus sp. D2-41]